MSWTPYEPCPHCGEQSDNFRQIIQQIEDINLNEDGAMDHAEVVGDSFEIVAVACTECDEVILGDDDAFPY